MWDGPYGDRNGSRKYLITSVNQSLKRMGLDYVDIFYHHVFDPNTPLEETALALDQIVREGKALYVGVSNYNSAQSAEIAAIFKELHTPFIVNQPSYSMLNRWVEEDGLDKWAKENGIGLSLFSPLFQGVLTDRYLNGVPEDSRLAKGKTSIVQKFNPDVLEKAKKLNVIAGRRGQKLSQLAIAWLLKNEAVTTVLIGASRPSQIEENVKSLENLSFTQEELNEIEAILKG
ncbi:aldo/keto reductase, partial [Treponema sp.]|uniref:aldo/keto reductase n=1 Tax=Treponema sp. TaxID=166 RepID=UPI00388E51FB